MKTIAVAALALALAVGAAGTGWGQTPAAGTVAGASQPEIVIKGKVDAVTVYRGQALVSRVVDLPAGAGLGEVVVSELPERVVPGSIFAEGSEGVEIRSVRYRERPVAQDVREEVRKVDDQIQALNDKLAGNTKQAQLLQDEKLYLDKLANFAAPTATVEMTKGVLNADQLKTLTSYQFDQRKAIADQELKLGMEHRTLNEQLALLQRQRAEVTGRFSRTLREAVVFVSRKAGGSIHVRYLVDAASWSPSYNIRADAAKKNATVEYQASIQQMSGEDWTDVSMTLSTATPNLVAAAPTLNPLSIALTSRTAMSPVDDLSSRTDYKTAQKELYVQQKVAEVNRGVQVGGNNGYFGNSNVVNSGTLQIANQAGQAYNPNEDNDKALNKVADQIQVLELLARDGRKEDDAESRRRTVSEGIVVTYQMRNRTSLPSRADQQLIQIDSLSMKSEFYKVAIPVLTTYVYDEATLTNTSSVVLLAGPVASYIGGQFVGSGAVPTVAVGQPFTVGFGIDSSLRASRERVDRTEQIQTGNKAVSYTYRLSVDNFGSTPAQVRLMDRLPTAKDTEVKITFVDADNVKISQDKEYQQSERKKGLLRWDVEVPPQKNGSEAFALTYKMNMEYDKNLAISASSVLRVEELQKLMEKK